MDWTCTFFFATITKQYSIRTIYYLASISNPEMVEVFTIQRVVFMQILRSFI